MNPTINWQPGTVNPKKNELHATAIVADDDPMIREPWS